MEIEPKVKINRIDENTLEITTTIKETLSNQEFYDRWAGKKIQNSQIQQQIENSKRQIENGERQIEILNKQIEEMTKTAKDCEARL